MTPLRWLQSGPAADSWRVYRDGQLVLDPVVAYPDETGVRSVELDPWPFEASYTMTAVNEVGESLPSNALLLPEPALWITLPCALLLLGWLHAR